MTRQIRNDNQSVGVYELVEMKGGCTVDPASTSIAKDAMDKETGNEDAKHLVASIQTLMWTLGLQKVPRKMMVQRMMILQ